MNNIRNLNTFLNNYKQDEWIYASGNTLKITNGYWDKFCIAIQDIFHGFALIHQTRRVIQRCFNALDLESEWTQIFLDNYEPQPSKALRLARNLYILDTFLQVLECLLSCHQTLEKTFLIWNQHFRKKNDPVFSIASILQVHRLTRIQDDLNLQIAHHHKKQIALYQSLLSIFINRGMLPDDPSTTYILKGPQNMMVTHQIRQSMSSLQSWIDVDKQLLNFYNMHYTALQSNQSTLGTLTLPSLFEDETRSIFLTITFKIEDIKNDLANRTDPKSISLLAEKYVSNIQKFSASLPQAARLPIVIILPNIEYWKCLDFLNEFTTQCIACMEKYPEYFPHSNARFNSRYSQADNSTGLSCIVHPQISKVFLFANFLNDSVICPKPFPLGKHIKITIDRLQQEGHISAFEDNVKLETLTRFQSELLTLDPNEAHPFPSFEICATKALGYIFDPNNNPLTALDKTEEILQHVYNQRSFKKYFTILFEFKQKVIQALMMLEDSKNYTLSLQGQTIRCHREILEGAFSFFQAKNDFDTAQKTSSSASDLPIEQELSPESAQWILQAIVQYAYTHEHPEFPSNASEQGAALYHIYLQCIDYLTP